MSDEIRNGGGNTTAPAVPTNEARKRLEQAWLQVLRARHPEYLWKLVEKETLR